MIDAAALVSRFTWLALLASTAVACGGSSASPATHADAQADSSGGSTKTDGGGDAGARHDATHPEKDAGHERDAAHAHDASHPRDAAHPDDAKRPTDAGHTHDATHADDAADAAKDVPGDVSGPADAGVDTGPPALRYVGRMLTDGTSPDGNGNCTAATPCFEWSGTEVVARFTGATEFDLTLSDYGNYFDVFVDGTLTEASPIIGSAYQSDYPLATGLTASETHEVILHKRTEASSFGRTMVLGYSFGGGADAGDGGSGTLLSPAPPAARRIEVVGDSISCGYGVLGPDATCYETAAYEDHDDSYGAITAKNLGADLFTIASSGRGAYINIDGTTTGTLPDIYGYTLPYISQGTPSSWDFAQWTPDVVVIDLGTNDFFGSPSGDPGQPFVSAYLALVQEIRHNYADAWIFCANGPILSGTDYTDAEADIKSVITTMNDPKVTYLGFPTQDPASGEGCDGHPSVTTQGLMATQRTAAIKSSLGW
jgi:lysophospholipase L1-like esterase